MHQLSSTTASTLQFLSKRARQIQLNMELSQQDREIAQLVARAKAEIEKFNEASKNYIRAFILAFDEGDIHKQPRHPFLPSTQKLEAAVSKRKAIFIEKAQVDDRVMKLELAKIQDRVPEKVTKLNELAFHQAIDIAKYQFGHSCEAWLNHVTDLLADAHSVNEKVCSFVHVYQLRLRTNMGSNSSMSNQASATTRTQAKYHRSKNRTLPPTKTTNDSERESLKRPLDSREQNEQTPETVEAKKQKKDDQPIVLSHQSHICRIPYQTYDETRDNQCSEGRTQDPDSDDLSIAEVLAQLGR